MRNSRNFNSLRPIQVVPDFCKNAYGSVLFSMGNTEIICAAHISKEVPEHAEKRGAGWLTAEYTMLPYSTEVRKEREFLKRDGRSVEIQRLISRSLRASVDLTKLQGFTVYIDCDVLRADGGTRTAAITGGFIALKRAIGRMLKENLILENPIVTQVAAVSVGAIDDSILLDLDFPEDKAADVDMNVVMNGKSELIEVQGTAEKGSFPRSRLNSLLDSAEQGISELFTIQNNW